MNDLRLVQSVNRLSQGVVIDVTYAADRSLTTGFDEAFVIAYCEILTATVGMMDQATLYFVRPDACSRVSSVKSALIDEEARHPTIIPEKTSMTKAA